MIKRGVAVLGAALVGLFGYYFLTDRSDRPNAEKARSAAVQVGDAVRDTGVAGLVDVRLKSKFGFDATRFLHYYYDEGRVVVYGLAPAGVEAEQLRNEALGVTGVREAEVYVHPRPEFIQPLKPLLGDSPAQPQPPAKPGGP